MFNSTSQTSSVLSNLSSLASQFSDCTSTTTYTDKATTGVIHNYQTCSEAHSSSYTYNLTHSYVVNSTTPISATSVFVANYDCGSNCVDLYKDYYGGNSGTFTISPGTTINSASIVEAEFNCGYPTSIDGTVVSPGSWKCYNVKHGVTPTDVPISPAINVSSDIPGAITSSNNLVTVSDGSNPNDYGGMGITIRLQYTIAPQISGDTWSSTSDTSSVLSYLQQGSVCTTTATCNSPVPTPSRSSCITVDGASVCPSAFTNATSISMSTIVNPTCTAVTVTGSCSATNMSIGCYTDAEGNQQCPSASTGTNTDSCSALVSQGCSYVSQQCADGATDLNGNCTDEVFTYDCGTSVSGTVPTATQTVSCAGSIQCMGTSCVNQSPTSNSNFAEVAAQLQAVRSAAMDSSCTSSGDTSTCSAFGGTNLACKKALGGYVNCCTHSATVSLADYLHLMFQVDDLMNEVAKVDPTSQLVGAWNTLSQPITSFGTTVSSDLSSAWSSVQQGFTGVVDSLGGTTTSAATTSVAASASTAGASASSGSISLAIAGLEQEGMQDAASWISNTFGEAAANSLFSTTAGGSAINSATGQVAGSLQFGGGAAIIGTALVWIGAAYAIYSIATTIIKLIYACESSELTLDSDRQLDECHYVGTYCSQSLLGVCLESKESYCCYASPLSRIIQEQARSQLGLGFGTSKDPNCGGLTIAQINDINWSEVDLSEWISIEESAGIFPSASSLTAASLTGSGSPLQAVDTTTRADAVTRSVARTSGIDVQGVQSTAASEIKSAASAPGL
jgi:conjugal transfer mating pair stabilization protein TraN